jgi:hypothetical protein
MRAEHDYYPTPLWCCRRLQEAVVLPPGRWLEPTAGDGAIIRAWDHPEIEWTAVEIQERWRERLGGWAHVVHTGDYLEFDGGPYAVAIGNPPYSLAQAVVTRALSQARICVMLLRLNILASAKRADWIRSSRPSVYVLPNRPSFRGKGTDATDYGWFIWGLHDEPRLRVLATTPLAERRGSRVGS